MKSYASIDRIERKWAVCEVELLPIEESKTEDFAIKDTVMIDVLLAQFPSRLGRVNTGDILVVEHDGEIVTKIYYKDNEEKARRIELLKSMINK